MGPHVATSLHEGKEGGNSASMHWSSIALELLQAGANADAINPGTGASVLKNAFLAPNARNVEALVKYHESHAATQGSTCSPLPLRSMRCVHSKAPPESASAASVLRVVAVHCVRSSTAALNYHKTGPAMHASRSRM